MAETALATAFVNIVPSMKGFSSSFKGQMNSQMPALGKSGGSSFKSGFSKAIGGLALFGGVTAGLSLIKKQMDALARIEVINKQTETVIKSMGNVAGVSAKHVQDLATALEHTTATEAESIQQGANLLLTFGNIRNEAGAGNDVFDQTTKLMVDLGRAMGQDAKTSAIQLGKALNDPTKGMTALTRVGVSFTKEEQNKIKALQASGDLMGAQKVILAALQAQFGGSGAAYATTFAGQLDLIKHAAGNVGEALVSVAMPGLKAFTGFIVENVIPATDAFSERWTNGQTVLQQVFKGNVGALTSSLNSMTQTVTTWLSGGGLTKLIEGFAAARAGIMNALAGALPGIVISLTNAIVQMLPGLISALLSMIPQLLQTAQTLFTSLATAAGIVLPTIITALADLLPRIITSLVSMLPSILQTAINLFLAILQGLMTAWPKIITALLNAIPTIVSALAKSLPLILNAGINLFLSLVDALVKVVPQILTTLTSDVLPKLIKTIVSLIPILIPAAIDLFLALVQGIAKATPQIIKAVIELIPVLIKALWDTRSQLQQAGIDLLKGLVKGIVDNAPKLVGGAIKAVADLAIGGFKSLLGIKSPSRVFIEFGKNIVQGLVNGLTSDSAGVEDAMTRVSEWVTDAFDNGKIYRKTAQAASKMVETYRAMLAPVVAEHDAVVEKLNAAQDNLKAKIEERLSFVQNITQKFGSSLSQDEKTTAADAIKQLKDRITRTKELAATMGDLQKLGLSGDLYQQILDAGNLELAKSIVAGGSAAVMELNTLAEQANATALELGNTAGDILFGKGIEVAQGVVDGLKSRESELSQLMASIAQAFTSAITAAIQADTRQADTARADQAAKAQDKAQKDYDAAVKKYGKNSKQAKAALAVLNRATAAESSAKATLTSNLRATVPAVAAPNVSGTGGAQQVINYYAAPNQSLDSEQQLRNAMVRASLVLG